MGKSIRLEMDVRKVAGRLQKQLDDALPLIASEVRSDCNRYVRVDQSTMKQSSYTASDLRSGKIVWNTPYAKRMYYTGTPSTNVNANASLRWCEKAKEQHAQTWLETAQKMAGGKA